MVGLRSAVHGSAVQRVSVGTLGSATPMERSLRERTRERVRTRKEQI